MSEAGLAIDPLAGLAADIPAEQARAHVASIVLGDAMSVTDANAALAARGMAPLNTNSEEYWTARKDALTKSDQFSKAFLAGDPDAISSLYQIDLKIAAASGKLTDRPMAAADYDLQTAKYIPKDAPGAMLETYDREFTGLASSIGLPQQNARALLSDHMAAVAETNKMDASELANWSEQQTAAIHSAIGEGAEAKLAEASKVLSAKSGRKLDLNAITRSNGASVGLNLYFQSQTLTKGK